MNSGKQCVNSDFCLYTVNPYEITVYIQKKSKKKKKEYVKVNIKQKTQSKHSRHNVNSRRLN